MMPRDLVSVNVKLLSVLWGRNRHETVIAPISLSSLFFGRKDSWETLCRPSDVSLQSSTIVRPEPAMGHRSYRGPLRFDGEA